MKIKKLIDSFNYAIQGLIYSARTQRNMKIHLVATFLVLSACFVYDISKVELLIITITITLVIAAELINTSVESAIDATTNYYHPLAKIAKNTAAGAVLVTAINAVIVGYIIFWDKLTNVTFSIILKIKHSDPYMVFIILVMVSIVTIMVKAIYGEGTPLRGGMPSGHSTIAFSIATIIALIAEEPVSMALSYLLAVIVAQSRVDSEVHSVQEVVVGAVFGTVLTVFIFKIFS
ncbi:diacylglycerol kinase [Clostridium algidicarnis]|uniref:Diacylglycerol kinase (ATP) n=2 Tax=Clostridium algidicarnis TaxID=37659 RepID=A0A2S6G101_9CLOT|nr:diacylglycerol kinase [Clostridium algidicarnis]MBB6630507.1 diacylglycerol kinase [Clostridium algidicarnis]MBB6696356.1 diacylglycerol kinase [Clostridium algidicarnis]MBU3193575.1 diacylglycerol kinase [Clostridium algidicarnis]MBU3203019.1 diacylglycerol kinase [Clostridium algidicarnis]MBU3211173.1 diacylglycerol kinase [Clostridium algidicarnis]